MGYAWLPMTFDETTIWLERYLVYETFVGLGHNFFWKPTLVKILDKRADSIIATRNFEDETRKYFQNMVNFKLDATKYSLPKDIIEL